MLTILKILCNYVQASVIRSLHRLKYDADDNDQRGSSEGNLCAKPAVEEIGTICTQDQSAGAYKDDVIQDLCQVLYGGPARTDAGDKAAALL